MHKYYENKQHRDLQPTLILAVLITLILIFSPAKTIQAQETKYNNSEAIDDKSNPQTQPKNTENDNTEVKDPKKLEKMKEIAELKDKLLNANDASRTLVLNSILLKAEQDKDYVDLINNEILVDKLDRTKLRDLLDAMSAIGGTSKNLLLSDFVPNLLILRINPDFAEKIDAILKAYSIENLFKGIETILNGIREINYDNQNIIRFAIDFASNEQFFAIIYQIKFIKPLINILNVNLKSENGNGNHNGIGIIYEIIHRKVNRALILITSFSPEKIDYEGWSAWWNDFVKKSEVEQYKILLENAHKRFSKQNKELSELRESTLIQKLRQNSKSYEINVTNLTDPANNVVLVALENIISMINENLFDSKNRDSLVNTLYNAWYSDLSVEVKKRITDLFLKLGGSEATLRVLFSFEKGIEIRRYIVERLSSEGKDGASLDKLIQIINERNKYPADIPKAAIIGLGKWNNYTDKRNVKLVLKTLEEIITIHDENNLAPIALANTINELASKFDISELIVHLFELKPFNPQQLVVFLLSALRSGNSPELSSWVIEYERKNEYLTGILKNEDSINDLIIAVFEIFEYLKESFIEPTVYAGLYDSLCNLYHTPPTGANGLFEQNLEKALLILALPYDPETKFADLSKELKQKVEKSALVIPELLMHRNLSDFVLKKLLPSYPQVLVQSRQKEFDILKVRLGLRSENWDQLNIFAKYKELVEKSMLSNENLMIDIIWSISLQDKVDKRIASRLIEAIQSVNPKTFEFTWKTIFEHSKNILLDVKSPKGEIQIFKIYEILFSLDSMKTLLENPTDKNLQAFIKLRENAQIGYEKWFSETEVNWLKYPDLTNEALDFAKFDENYRVVLSNLIKRLIKASDDTNELAKIWKFIDEISTEKNLSLPRYKDSLTKNEVAKQLKEMETIIKLLSMK